MSRYAIIENGIVINVAVADAEYAAEQGWVAASSAGIGWTWDGAEFSAPPEPPAPPVESIPMLNLQLVLIEDGHLATVQGVIASMSGDNGLRARAYWDKALTARRDNPLVNQLWPMLYEDEAAFNTAWSRAAAMNP